MRQIDAIDPKIMVLMGEYARRIPRKKGIEYIETYHRASAMHFRNTRRVFERDIKRFASRLISL